MDKGALNPFEKLNDNTDIREKILRNYRVAIAGVGAVAIIWGGAELASRSLDQELNKQPNAPKLSDKPSDRADQLVALYQQQNP